MKNQVHSDDLLEYMAAKYNWTKPIMDSIDWDFFNFCYSKQPIHKMTNIIKYIHGWQYTKGKEQQFNSKSSSLCPAGCREHETQHHYLTCKEPTWIQKVKEETSKLKRRLTQIQTAPVIASIILHAIAQSYNIMESWPEPFSKSESVAYMAAVEQQKIGWKHILQGRLSKKWIIAQNFHLQMTHGISQIPQSTLELWKKTFLPTLIQYGLDLWELRNKVVHGSTPRESAQIKRLQLNREITVKYMMGESSVSPAQKRLFQKPEILRLRDSNRSKRNWLITVNIAQQARQLQLKKLHRLFPRLNHFQGFTITAQPPRQHRIRLTQPPPRKTKGIQKTLRELFLNAHPSVRYRQGDEPRQSATS